jgi:dihydroflavonol-4-reductase
MENVAAFAEALAGRDVVFHTAAYFREYYQSAHHWPKLEAINIRGTLALAETARARGIRRLVNTSSSGTIGFGADGSPGDEDTSPGPIAHENLYFKSKIVAAERLRDFAARSGLEVVQVLPGWMFGPWDAAPTASGRLVLDFLAGALPAVPPGGTNAVDARDVAFGMIRAAEHGRSGHSYILGGGFVTLRDITDILSQVTGLPAPRRHIPYPVAWAYAALAQTWARMTGGETLVSVAAVRMMQARLRVSSAKAKREFAWRHRPLHETLRDEVAWYRSHAMGRERAPAA